MAHFVNLDRRIQTLVELRQWLMRPDSKAVLQEEFGITLGRVNGRLTLARGLGRVRLGRPRLELSAPRIASSYAVGVPLKRLALKWQIARSTVRAIIERSDNQTAKKKLRMEQKLFRAAKRKAQRKGKTG